MSTKTISSGYPSGYSINGSYGTITITPSGSIGGTGMVGGTVTAYTIINSGTIINSETVGIGTNTHGVFLKHGGVIINHGFIEASYSHSSSGSTAIEISGLAGTVTNYGTIEGTAYGVVLDKGGVVSNTSTGLIESTIPGTGVVLGPSYGGAATLTNAGTIQATGSGTYGFAAYGVAMVSGGMITNTGTIDGRDIGVSLGTSQTIGVDATLINYGLIEAPGTDGYGVLCKPATGTHAHVTNTSAGIVNGHYYALVSDDPSLPASTLINEGTLTAIKNPIRALFPAASTIFTNTSTGTITGGTLGIGKSIAVVDFDFTRMTELILYQGAPTIYNGVTLTNFGIGNKLDLRNVSYVSGVSVAYASGTITVTP